MKNRLILLFLLCIIGTSSYGDAIVKRNYPSHNITRPSSIIYTNTKSNVDDSSLESAISEIKAKIKTSPNDYILYASLVDLYLQSNQYDKSYNELVFLNNLSVQNKLDENIKSYIKTIINNKIKNARYERNKSDLYINLALAQLILGNIDKSENYIVLASENNFNTALMRNAITVIFNTTHNFEKAIDICDKILIKNPQYNDIRKLKASYFLQLQNKNAAIGEYNQILNIDPNDYESRYNLYKILITEKMSEKELISRLYNTNKPDYEKVFTELTDILFQNGDIESAKMYANALVDNFSNNAQGYIFLSEIYKKEGNLKDSYDILLKARDKADNNDTIAKYNVMLAKLSDQPLKEANSLMEAGLYQQALEVLKSANPENLYIILAQARANYYLKNKQTCLELLNKAMSLYPENSDVYCAFAYIYLKEGEIASARKYVEKSLKINPQNKTASSLLDLVNNADSEKYMNQIVSYVDSQNYTEALKLVDEALSINPKSSVLHYYKALIMISQTNFAAATAPLYKSIELDKNNVPSYFYLGFVFDNLSEPENALLYYKKFIELLGDDIGESEKLNYAKQRIKKLKN